MLTRELDSNDVSDRWLMQLIKATVSVDVNPVAISLRRTIKIHPDPFDGKCCQPRTIVKTDSNIIWKCAVCGTLWRFGDVLTGRDNEFWRLVPR